MIKPINQTFVDGENTAINCDVVYRLDNKSWRENISAIKQEHGDNVRFLPISANSAGGGIFQQRSELPVVGLYIAATPEPRVSIDDNNAVDLDTIELDQIIICPDQQKVCCGSAITLDQLNQCLGNNLGAQYKVLGADLTSYTYAQTGATFMTGGMGPQRRYFSDSVLEAAIYDGESHQVHQQPSLNDHAGTFGWTGIVTAVCCKFVELPANEVAFAIPVNNHSADLARLLSHLAEFCYLEIIDGKLLTDSSGNDLILGLEHITVKSMQPFMDSGDEKLIRKARLIINNCESAGADGVIFANGFTDLAVDEFLLQLVDSDNNKAGNEDIFTIAGIDLESTTLFDNPEEMRAIREGIPFAARTQAPGGEFLYKGHTDLTIRLNRQNVETSMVNIWNSFNAYIEQVNDFFSDADPTLLRGEILVYGHMNPYGLDPHNRITMAGDNQEIFAQAVITLENYRNELYLQLKNICDDTESIMIGGEKSAASEAEVFTAFSGSENAPVLLKEKFNKQFDVIAAAPDCFSWRAIPPYASPKS